VRQGARKTALKTGWRLVRGLPHFQDCSVSQRLPDNQKNPSGASATLQTPGDPADGPPKQSCPENRPGAPARPNVCPAP